MKNYDVNQKQLQVSDPIESYFNCILSCDLNDRSCIYECFELLKEFDNLNF